jgi:hypothetical protein
MRERGQSFIVERRKSRSNDAPSPADARRSRRGHRTAGLMPVHVDEFESGVSIEVRLGVVTVGSITHDAASKGYFWAVYLPGFSPMPKPARDVETARRVILSKVREWCEAASVISVRRAH